MNKNDSIQGGEARKIVVLTLRVRLVWETITRSVMTTLMMMPLMANVTIALAGQEVVNVSASPHVKFRSIELGDARWTGGFWGDRWDMDRQVAIPTMKQVMELPTNSAKPLPDPIPLKIQFPSSKSDFLSIYPVS